MFLVLISLLLWRGTAALTITHSDLPRNQWLYDEPYYSLLLAEQQDSAGLYVLIRVEKESWTFVSSAPRYVPSYNCMIFKCWQAAAPA
jgi:hypothetical protein